MLHLSATSTFLSTVIFFHYVLVPVFSKTEKKSIATYVVLRTYYYELLLLQLCERTYVHVLRTWNNSMIEVFKNMLIKHANKTCFPFLQRLLFFLQLFFFTTCSFPSFQKPKKKFANCKKSTLIFFNFVVAFSSVYGVNNSQTERATGRYYTANESWESALSFEPNSSFLRRLRFFLHMLFCPTLKFPGLCADGGRMDRDTGWCDTANWRYESQRSGATKKAKIGPPGAEL